MQRKGLGYLLLLGLFRVLELKKSSSCIFLARTARIRLFLNFCANFMAIY